MRNSEAAIIKRIKKNLSGRQIALRWKNESFEKVMAEEGLMASIYISENPERIDNIHTFPSSFLKEKRNEYYLIVCPALQQNAYENEKYSQYGYGDERDILWMNHLPIKSKQAEQYDNKFQSESDINVMFTGWGASVSIGKNVKFPKNTYLAIPSDSNVKIGDNVNLNGCSINLYKGSELNIKSKVDLRGAKVLLFEDGKLDIGEGSTISGGVHIRCHRNNHIIIGRDCMFSWDTVVLAQDGHLIFDLDTCTCTNNTIGEGKDSIVIGDHVWVGGEVAILSHSCIGSGSICGYRAVIKGTFPNNCIIGGTPAGILKKNIAWMRDNICLDENMLYKLPAEYRELTGDCEF